MYVTCLCACVCEANKSDNKKSSQKLSARKQRFEKGQLAGGEGVIFGERAPVVMIKNQ